MAGLTANAIAKRIDTQGQSERFSSTSTLLYPKIEQVIKALFSSLFPMLNNDIDQYRKAHKQLIRASTHIAECLPLHIQDAVRRIDNNVTASLNALAHGEVSVEEPKTLNEVRAWLIIRQTFWLGQARRRANFLETVDINKLNALIARQPDAQRKKLDYLVTDIIGASVFGSSSGGRCQMLIHGPPGTGKSTFVEYLVDALGAKRLKFNQEELTSDDLMGISNTSAAYSLPTLPGAEPGFAKIKGALRDGVTKIGVKNSIVVLDEFRFSELQKVPWKLSQYNALLDPDVQASSSDGDLEDLSEVIFIILTNENPAQFLSNNNPDRDTNAAFFNRLPAIEMAPLSKDILERALRKHTMLTQENAATTLGLAPAPVSHTFPDQRCIRPLDVNKLEYAHRKVTGILDNFSQLILAENTDPGARTAQRIVRQIYRYAFVKYYLAEEEDYEVAHELIEDLIKGASANG